ncbi:unnamed protein product [Fraxinus pennsylvanica]|uniref:Uncharacterized protein n=1 Tax=Fraxinus pennsylvanica TaxID=56036 RepID=A0AAD2E6C6_9LAMI|nr:unnamed protein product [Fraxinus pennsylvanica]
MSSFFLPDINDPLLADPHTTGTPSSPYTTSDHRLPTRPSETPPTSPFGGQIWGFKVQGYIDGKNNRRLDDCLRYCNVAGKKALEGTHLGGDRLEKVHVNPRKLLKVDATLDYDYAGPNPKHDSRGRSGGNGGKNP